MCLLHTGKFIVANFSDPALLNKQDIEAVSRWLIKNSVGENCTFPLDLLAIIEAWGIETEYINDNSLDYVAKITLTRCPRITINSQYNKDELKDFSKIDPKEAARLRFSIGHELGHFALNAHNDPDIRTHMLEENHSYFTDKYKRKVEAEADKFAAALLMPDFAMKNYLNYANKPLEAAQKISTDFAVSLTPAFLRLAKLSDNIVACLFIHTSTQKIKRVEYSKNWSDIRTEHYPYKCLYIDRNTEIPSGSATAKLLKNSEATVKGIRNSTNIDRWFSNYKGENKIHEWPYLFSDRIITFIEVDYPDI